MVVEGFNLNVVILVRGEVRLRESNISYLRVFTDLIIFYLGLLMQSWVLRVVEVFLSWEGPGCVFIF